MTHRSLTQLFVTNKKISWLRFKSHILYLFILKGKFLITTLFGKKNLRGIKHKILKFI